MCQHCPGICRAQSYGYAPCYGYGIPSRPYWPYEPPAARKERRWIWAVVIPIALAIALRFFTPQASVRPVEALKFLNDKYFSAVTQPSERKIAYNEDLTPAFRANSSFGPYVNFWQGEKSAKVYRLWADDGNPSAFKVAVIYHSSDGRTRVTTEELSFACGGRLVDPWQRIIDTLRSHLSFWGCPSTDLQIDNQGPPG
jgi:hypothetical protein